MQFNENFYGGRVIGVEDIFLWSSMYEGVRIYGKTINHNLTLID